MMPTDQTPAGEIKEAVVATPENPKPDTNKVPRFRVGQMIPIGGVWFQLERIEKEGLFLKPIGFTKKGAPR